MSRQIGVVNAAMFGTVTEGFEHVDWSTPDLFTESDFEDMICATIEDYAAASPHMIIFEIPEDRSYLVGFPVVVTVHDDGSISLEICAEDIVEAIADDDDSDVAASLADSATAGAAFASNNIRALTVNTPEGA